MQRGAVVSLAAVAQGGGVEALEWALRQLPGAAAGLLPEVSAE